MPKLSRAHYRALLAGARRGYLKAQLPSRNIGGIENSGDLSYPNTPDRPVRTDCVQSCDRSPVHENPLDAALLVAAKAGDATTVAKIMELMQARQRGSAGNVVALEERTKRT